MHIRRYMLRLLLVFVCLFVLFSHSLTVCAADSSEEISTFFGEECPIVYENPYISTYSVDVNGYSVNVYARDINNTNWLITQDSIDISDVEMLQEDGSLLFYYVISLPETISKGEVSDIELDFVHSSGDVILNYDDHRTIGALSSNSTSLLKSFTINITAQSKTRTRVSFSDFSCSNGAVKYLYVYFRFFPDEEVTTFETTMNKITITEVSSNGLLGNIIDFVKKIWTGITELPQNIANSIKGFFDNVVNAVTNLGNFIIDGIKGLFIPSEEDITNMKDKWDTLLSDRFGALYQVAGLISDYAASFKEQSKNTITFPSISIPLVDATFEFGGWEVQVVPDGFGIIFDTLKMITSILATMLFINGLKNRFDKIMGGADDI